ncbi:arginase-1-like [Tubulanus polymorphus]|uniref:arginase-1-like n=1 Tax=Tubulanus polymorphus TaxID=672921 RepID=UPI003DA2D330
MSLPKYEGRRGSAKTIGLMGVPFAGGQPKGGVDDGPEAIRNGTLVKKLESYDLFASQLPLTLRWNWAPQDSGWEVADFGDLQFHFDSFCKKDEKSFAKNVDKVASACHKVSKQVEASVNAYDHTIVLGGDHSGTIGSIHGHAQANSDICVLWIDAHADLNTPHTSFSGNMHGMPLAFLLHEMEPYLSKQSNPIDWCKPCLSVKNLAYIGLRDVDPAERYFLDHLGICAFTMEEIDIYGLGPIVKQALDVINPNNERRIHVSFDIDALDPVTVAPSTGTPVPGGLTMRDGYFIMETVAKTGRLAVMDLMEVNPNIGTQQDVQRTVWAANEMILTGMGKRRSGTLPVHFKPPARLD